MSKQLSLDGFLKPKANRQAEPSRTPVVTSDLSHGSDSGPAVITTSDSLATPVYPQSARGAVLSSSLSSRARGGGRGRSSPTRGSWQQAARTTSTPSSASAVRIIPSYTTSPGAGGSSTRGSARGSAVRESSVDELAVDNDTSTITIKNDNDISMSDDELVVSPADLAVPVMASDIIARGRSSGRGGPGGRSAHSHQRLQQQQQHHASTPQQQRSPAQLQVRVEIPRTPATQQKAFAVHVDDSKAGVAAPTASGAGLSALSFESGTAVVRGRGGDSTRGRLRGSGNVRATLAAAAEIMPGRPRRSGPSSAETLPGAAVGANEVGGVAGRGGNRGRRGGAAGGSVAAVATTRMMVFDGLEMPILLAAAGRRTLRPRMRSPSPEGVWSAVHPPRFVPFLCEWVSCKAELVNLETLRRHVRIVHGRPDETGDSETAGSDDSGESEAGEAVESGGVKREKRDGPSQQRWRCRWGKRCGTGTRLWKEGTVFDNKTDWELHVEQRHLVPFEWHVGDGPRNTLHREPEDRNKVPKYLLDSNGNQVTPWTKNQRIEGSAGRRKRRKKLRELLLRRDENLPSEDEMDITE